MIATLNTSAQMTYLDRQVLIRAVALTLCFALPSSLSAQVADDSVQTRQRIEELFQQASNRSTQEKPAEGGLDLLLKDLRERKPAPLEQADVDRVINSDFEESTPSDGSSALADQAKQDAEDHYEYRGTVHQGEEAQYSPGDSRTQKFESHLDEWQLARTTGGMAIVMSRHDRGSAVQVIEGMVLGHLGRIKSITEVEGRLELVFTNGGKLVEG